MVENYTAYNALVKSRLKCFPKDCMYSRLKSLFESLNSTCDIHVLVY
jgi:hypothetical protein